MLFRAAVLLALAVSAYGACPEVPAGACAVCGAGLCISKPDVVVTIPGQDPQVCKDIQQAGLDANEQLVPFCALLPGIVVNCGCDAVGIVGTPATPAPTPIVVVTPAPVAAIPDTEAPISAAPVEAAPVTAAPVTDAPMETDSPTLSPTFPPTPAPTPKPTIKNPTKKPTKKPTRKPTRKPTTKKAAKKGMMLR